MGKKDKNQDKKSGPEENKSSSTEAADAGKVLNPIKEIALRPVDQIADFDYVSF